MRPTHFITIKEAMTILYNAGVYITPAGLRYNAYKYRFIKKDKDMHHDLYDVHKLLEWLQNRKTI